MSDIWQDREIRFDIAFSDLTTRKGEYEIDSINSVEDTKGNNGEKGSLSITNLRILWCCHSDPKTNLSIGLNTIQSISIKSTSSKLRGTTQAIHILTQFNNSRFEFVFTSLIKNSPRLFTTIISIHKSYETTRLYRDLKLRGAIIKDLNLILLPYEDIYNRIEGVWNLSSDQGNLGTMFITNVRLVWHANLASNFNVSIPYLQIKLIKIRDSKFGHALVIETSSRSGGYVLGFRIDPIEKLQSIYKEITTLHQVYSQTPLFGVQYQTENIADSEKLQKLIENQRKQDEIEIQESTKSNEQRDVLTAYLAEQEAQTETELKQKISNEKEKISVSKSKPIVYNEQLGLAIEQVIDGMTIEELWQVAV